MHDNIRSSRILLLDEDIGASSLLRNVLNRVGYANVVTLTDFSQIVDAVSDQTPDLIMLDLPAVEEAGFSALKEARADRPKTEWTPVVIISDSADPDLRRRAFAAGVSEFLAKPFEWPELVMRVRNVLTLQKHKETLQEQNRVLEYRVAARTKSLSERTAELEQALADLRGAQKQVLQQERFRAFGEMAGGIAHDFNNVLMCVVGYTELLLNDRRVLGATPTVEKFLRTMNRAGHDASRIVARLRDFYRPREEADVFTPTDLNKLMEEVVPLTQPKWKNQALTGGSVIEVVLDLEKVPTIPCSAPEIRETVVNLIFNAVDAMPQGGTITLKTRVEEKFVCLGVSDTGTGMSEETRQRCLEPFFSTKGEKGTGLGLAMVFGIAKRHDGTVDIESELGKGTTFWIRLSRHLTEQGTVVTDEVTIDQSLHILVVDDEELPRDILTRYLSADGHHVEAAVDAYDASRKFDLHPYDLVITDHAMPGINGCQLAVNLKKRANPAILLVTGSSALLESDERPAGIDHIIGKPITQQGLRNAMARALRRGGDRPESAELPADESPASSPLAT